MLWMSHTINTTTGVSFTQSFIHFKFIRKIHKIWYLELAAKRTEATEINGSAKKIDVPKYNKSEEKKTYHRTQIQPTQNICASEKATVLNISRNGNNTLALFFLKSPKPFHHKSVCTSCFHSYLCKVMYWATSLLLSPTLFCPCWNK